MTRGYVPLLLTLSAIWGASYLFIKVGVRDFEPATLMAIRLLLAAPVLVAFLALRSGVRGALGEMREAWLAGLVLGAINAAIPFTLIAWGEKHIDSGVAAIANATVPIFVVLLAIRFRPSERASGLRLGGILLGFVGIAILAGAGPDAGAWAVAGTLAVVLASFSYACGALYAQGHAEVRAGPVLAAVTTVTGGVLLLPFAVAQPPADTPGWKSVASLLALSLFGTALAQLLLFRMLRLYGASRGTLVTYLMPLFALVYGGVLLDEPITLATISGLVLILLGVALGSGLLRLRRAPVVEPYA